MEDGTTGRADASNDGPNRIGDIPGTPPQGSVPLPSEDIPLVQPKPEEKQIGADIAKILQDVKLSQHSESGHPPSAGIEIAVPDALRNIDAPIAPTPTTPAPDSPELQSSSATPAITTPTTSSVQKDALKSVHTLKHDLQSVVQTQKISLVKAVALEQEKPKPEIIVPERPRSNAMRNTLFIAALLMVLGGSALFGVYVVVQSKSAPLPAVTTDSLVFAERTVGLEIDNQSPTALRQILSEARAGAAGSLGSITRIAPVKSVIVDAQTEPSQRIATLDEFFAAIGARPPDSLMRALSDEFFFGFHTVDENAPLFVIKVSSYSHAFAGMLEWEKTINADLSPVFAAVPSLTIGPDGLPVERTFTDVVMRNYDVRALKDDAGDVQMYYSFPTRDTLVIAESPYTFNELLSRLQAVRSL